MSSDQDCGHFVWVGGFMHEWSMRNKGSSAKRTRGVGAWSGCWVGQREGRRSWMLVQYEVPGTEDASACRCLCKRERERGRIRYFLIGRSVCLSLSLSMSSLYLTPQTLTETIVIIVINPSNHIWEEKFFSFLFFISFYFVVPKSAYPPHQSHFSVLPYLPFCICPQLSH